MGLWGSILIEQGSFEEKNPAPGIRTRDFILIHKLTKLIVAPFSESKCGLSGERRAATARVFRIRI